MAKKVRSTYVKAVTRIRTYKFTKIVSSPTNDHREKGFDVEFSAAFFHLYHLTNFVFESLIVRNKRGNYITLWSLLQVTKTKILRHPCYG